MSISDTQPGLYLLQLKHYKLGKLFQLITKFLITKHSGPDKGLYNIEKNGTGLLANLSSQLNGG